MELGFEVGELFDDSSSVVGAGGSRAWKKLNEGREAVVLVSGRGRLWGGRAGGGGRVIGGSVDGLLERSVAGIVGARSEVGVV